MPYPAGHRDRVRSRIVESARRLFNRAGFDGVSVNAIMADAGLTRGGFYTYFASKTTDRGGRPWPLVRPWPAATMGGPWREKSL
jgi:hypothetical protein